MPDAACGSGWTFSSTEDAPGTSGETKTRPAVPGTRQCCFLAWMDRVRGKLPCWQQTAAERPRSRATWQELPLKRLGVKECSWRCPRSLSEFDVVSK